MQRLLVPAVVPLLILCGCGEVGSASSGGPKVVASVYPLGFVAERVAGGRADVVQLTPAGTEPHDIELTSDQVVDVSEADLLLYVGEGFQPAVENLTSDLGDAAVDVLDAVDALRVSDEQPAGTSAIEHGNSDSDAVDPHVWLDPDRLAEIAELTADRLADVDPGGADDYKENAGRLSGELDDLDSEYATGLRNCARKEIVVAHEAFGYLADRYGLDQIGIAGLDPESEPSPQRIADVAEFARANDVKAIFFEELVSPKIAETIASETGASTEVLNPLESPPVEGDYLTEMRANLAALRSALECK